MKHFSKDFPNLGESTVRLFKKQYRADLKKAGSKEEITQLTKKKRGKSLVLSKLDEKIQQYIRALGKAGTPVNDTVEAHSCVDNSEIHSCECQSSFSCCRRDCHSNRLNFAGLERWVYQTFPFLGLLIPQKDGLCEEKDNLKALTQDEFAAVKKQYLRQIKKAVKDGKIPPEPVINWDQTGVNVVPTSQWTQEERGNTKSWDCQSWR